MKIPFAGSAPLLQQIWGEGESAQSCSGRPSDHQSSRTDMAFCGQIGVVYEAGIAQSRASHASACSNSDVALGDKQPGEHAPSILSKINQLLPAPRS